MVDLHRSLTVVLALTGACGSYTYHNNRNRTEIAHNEQVAAHGESPSANNTDREFRVTGPGQRTFTIRPTVTWTPLNGGVRYELQIGVDQTCDPPLQSFSLPPVTSQRIEALSESRTYFVCLRGFLHNDSVVEAYNNGHFRFTL